MRVWLVTVGEPLPTDGDSPRLLRAGILADALASRGHEVLWWTSTFDHANKRQRAASDTRRVLRNGLVIYLLHGCGYRRNVSFRRILDHTMVARSFLRSAKAEPRPEVIVCSLPTLELAVAATQYARRMGVPVVVDVRDLWPDLFAEMMPTWARPLVLSLLYPMRRQARLACGRATAIIGNAPGMVAWGLKQAKRSAGSFDRDFPFGYETKPLDENQRARAVSFWKERKIVPEKSVFTACYFGVLGRHHEFETVIEAARILEKGDRHFRFVLCGTGDRMESLRRDAVHLKSVYLPGWVGAPEIRVLMEMSQAGLAPYRSHLGYTNNMPNKPIEYLSAGLPVISTLQGYLSEFLGKYACGVTCKNKDPVGLARTLSDFADDQKKLKVMSDNARRVFAEQFEADKVYGAMTAYVEAIAQQFRNK